MSGKRLLDTNIIVAFLGGETRDRHFNQVDGISTEAW
jgi:hypothetical protein